MYPQNFSQVSSYNVDLTFREDLSHRSGGGGRDDPIEARAKAEVRTSKLARR
ncbi:hypothetical protein Ac2012v2_004211 [Leucoagaricus gongylophorus]